MTCFECGEAADHLHHVVPRVRGGTKVVPLCDECHGKVHDLDLTDHKTLTRAALAAKRARGEKLGGLVPYGHRLAADGVRLERDEDEQAVIATVRELGAAGMSRRKIVSELAARGVVSRVGRPLQLTQVARILTAEIS